MTALPVSVVVVSRGRPDSLKKCLAGLARLHYPNYEIIVVADAAGLQSLHDTGLTDEVKIVAFDEANISKARNRGIAVSAGEVVAFIDDDAVPEPTWLDFLMLGFEWPEAAAAGGYVRGRNGISFQWKARSVDRTGFAVPLDIDESDPVLLTPPPGRAIKTEGTNMAVRRDVLAGIGGFDTVFRFYLDETDLNMRLAREGHATAIVPGAQVHHAFAESSQRAPDRAPRDLFDVGASTAAFLRKHCPVTEHRQVLARLTEERHTSLLGYMIDGRIEPRDVRRLMRRLEDGIDEGWNRPLTTMPPIPHSPHWFLPFESRATGDSIVISGRYRQVRALRQAAREAAATGTCVTLFLLSRTALSHVSGMTAPGLWEQRGGLWGRSERSQPFFRLTRFARRVAEETARVAPQRGIAKMD